MSGEFVSRQGLIEYLRTTGLNSVYEFDLNNHSHKATPATDISGTEEVKDGSAKRILASSVQDGAILEALRSAGLDPLRLPKNSSGKPGVPAIIRNVLVGKHHAFPKDGTQFKKAWERMMSRGEITYC